MPVFLYIPLHAQSRQTFESVGLFLLTQTGLDSNFSVRIRCLEQS